MSENTNKEITEPIGLLKEIIGEIDCRDKVSKYLDSLPKIYMIARWVGYGIRGFPFAGKCTTDGIPFVWMYDDCNGTCDRYLLCKLTDTTTGWIYVWTTSKSRAEEIAAALNEKVREGWRNK